MFFFFFLLFLIRSNLPKCRTDSPLISKCSQEFTNSRAPLWFHSPPYFWGLRVGKHGVTILAFWRLSWLDLAEHPRTCWGSDSSVELRWSRWTVLGSWESAKRQWISKKTTSSPAAVCSPCCCLTSSTGVSSAIPPDHRAASFSQAILNSS